MKELTIEQKAQRYDEALKRARECHVDGLSLHQPVKDVLEYIFHELKESEDEKIRKAMIKGLSSCASKYWGGFEIKAAIAWLEKQGEQEQLYIRFGEIPTDEKSKIFQGEIEVGTENGVSAYPAFKTSEGDIVLGLSLPITKTTLYTQQHLIEYDDRPCYLVKGDYVGKDTDGQPLINNVSIIEKIDTYRVKEEKQDEQKPIVVIPKFRIGDTMRTKQEAADNITGGMPVVISIDDEYYHCTNELIAIKDQDDYEFPPINVKQKPTDKVEPKFKVDEWTTNGDYTWQIVNVTDLDYILKSQNGHIVDDTTSHVDEQFHSFSIEDAKDGDVLACLNDAGDRDVIFIFKNINSDEGWVFCFCAIDANGCFCTNNDYVGNNNSTNIHPATKEQRDLLFQKMKEAGYEWDAEKKELTKIEQNPTWSEDDEKDFKQLLDILHANGYESFDNWLKSLKDRNTWKPSDEQIDALRYVTNFDYGGHKATLVSLYEQLKKLKE